MNHEWRGAAHVTPRLTARDADIRLQRHFPSPLPKLHTTNERAYIANSTAREQEIQTIVVSRETVRCDRTEAARSRIEKLSIQGIRSFDPKDAQQIAFDGPLTLIVGWNGSGKTTIIECLKYATTGELPPNSKTGGAFIHDPKLCGEKEMFAQVRISFRATSGIRMVATRSLQLLVKKNTRSQKTLEGVLKMKVHGVTESLSSRVAELDQIIPQYLGVSKAILENVIFCHQDDSLWPLSEPAVLKKKFDEIFEALKYTKAIDNLKVLRKKQNEELGKYKIIEQHAKEDKIRGQRSEENQAKLYDELEALHGEARKTEEMIEEAKERSKEAFQHAARYEQIVAQLNGKRITLKANQESAADLEVNLKHMAESDEELQSMLDQYEERVGVYVDQQEEFRQQYSEFQTDLTNNRDGLGVKQSQIGKHQAEKEQHEHQLQQRENLIRESAKQHAIRGFDYAITDKHVSEFQGIIGKMSKDQNNALDRARSENQGEVRKAQGDINNLTQRKSALNSSKDMSRSQIATNDKRISDFQKDMDRISVDEGSEATAKDKKNDIEQQLKRAKSEAESARHDERIREVDESLRALDAKKEDLDEELENATQLESQTAQIKFMRDELKTAKQSLETMHKVHGSRISQLVDSEWEPATLEGAFERTVSQKAAKVKEAESRRDIVQTKLDNLNFKMSSVESDREQKRADLQKYTKIVRDSIGQEDMSEFEEALHTLEEQYELSTTDHAKFQAQVDYMRSCLKVARDDDVCRLCRRPLHDNKALHFTKAEFMANLESIITKAQKNVQVANVDDLFAELEIARNAKPSYELATRLRDSELPALERDLAKLASEREAVNQQLEEQDSIVYDLQAAKQDVESLSKVIQSIVKYFNQCSELEHKIRELAETHGSGGLSRDVKAIREDVKKVGEAIRENKAVYNRLTGAREKSMKLINSLELAVRDMGVELNNAQSKLKEKRDLAERVEELKSHNNEHREAARACDRDMQDLVPQIEQAQARYDDIERRGNERLQRLQDEASSLSDTLRQLVSMEKQINAYVHKGGPQQLATTQQEIINLNRELKRIEEEQKQVTRRLKHIEDTIRDTETTKRAISDNLRYRKAKRSLQALSTEIQQLESHNAESDQNRYELEGQHWENEWTSLTAEHGRQTGAMGSMDKQLEELIKQWETDYKDAAKNYREAHIRVETTKAAVEDLGRYATALDKAIMKYHTLKMEEINQIIGELWKSAYQGTDVDTIRIRSDNETGKGNRTYNYRVVMVKQETEMDMRGRCSAGQKVLASIVIRLALAECFGTNCGLIALDEPTTNLDQQNIQGLAESLSEIIKIRRKQANFQLIVITHDEQFLKAMNCAEYADVYWRVDRNHNQDSMIMQQQISEVAM